MMDRRVVVLFLICLHFQNVRYSLQKMKCHKIHFLPDNYISRCFITKGRYASENTINEPNLEAVVEDEESKSQVEDKDLPKMENKAEWVSENQNRIVGGSLASPGQFPFIASLKNKYGSSYASFCGGAAIASNYVVTAAHCVAVSLD